MTAACLCDQQVFLCACCVCSEGGTCLFCRMKVILQNKERNVLPVDGYVTLVQSQKELIRFDLEKLISRNVLNLITFPCTSDAEGALA